MDVYYLLQFIVHTLVPVVPVITHQTDLICAWKRYNCTESTRHSSSIIHSKALQLTNWTYHLVIPYVRTSKHEAWLVFIITVYWIKSAIQTFSVTRACYVELNIQKQSLKSPVIQLQQLVTQFTKEFNSKTWRKIKDVTIVRSKTMWMVPWLQKLTLYFVAIKKCAHASVKEFPASQKISELYNKNAHQ